MVKANRDENKPKKPSTSWIYFLQEKRKGLMDSGKKVTEVSKILGCLWKDMNDDAKKPYTDLAGKDKKRYDEAMKNYVPLPKPDVKLDVEVEDGVGKKKAKKEKKEKKEGPKKTLSAYFMYSADRRQSIKDSNPGITQPGIMKAVGKEWSGLNKEDKKVWEDRAAEAKDNARIEFETKN